MGKEHFQETSVEPQILRLPRISCRHASTNFLRLSLLKAAHVVVSSTAWQEIRVRRDDSKESVAVDKEWLPMLGAEKIDKVTVSQDDGFTGAWDLTG